MDASRLGRADASERTSLPPALLAKEEALLASLTHVGRIMVAFSGGVDSTVAAILVSRSIGDRLTCIFVDTGVMRAGEGDEVVDMFREHYNIPLIRVDAADEFLGNLAGVSDPERKRKIIGNTFIDVFQKATRKVGKAAIRHAFIPQFAGQFGRMRFHTEDMFLDVEGGMALIRWLCTLEEKERQGGYRGLDILHFRDGKLVEKHTYAKTKRPASRNKRDMLADRTWPDIGD